MKPNFENLYTDGSFNDFMVSVRNELQKVVNENAKEKSIQITVEDCDWSDSDNGDRIPAKAVRLGKNNHFSIARYEFYKGKENLKLLRNVTKSRYMGALYSLECLREMYIQEIRQLEPDWKTPDDYER